MELTTRRIVAFDSSSIAFVSPPDTVHHRRRSVGLVFTADSFAFVARGEGTYHVNGVTGRFGANTLIGMPPGFRFASIGAYREIYVVSVRDARITVHDQRDFTPVFQRPLSAGEGETVHTTMQTAAQRIAGGGFGPKDVAQLKDHMLSYVWRGSLDAPGTALNELFASLWQRLSDPLPVAHLAREIGYTANYLSDLVRERTGRSVGGWIADMRMARARTLLEHTDLQVADIGSRCGYHDPSYFARAFHRVHGVSPLAWRVASRPLDARHPGMTLTVEAFNELVSHNPD